MRAIDEVEDHPLVDNVMKAKILRQISLNLQSGTDKSASDCFSLGLNEYNHLLPEVTLRVGEWALLAPESIAPRVWDATAAMADRMAYWAENNWIISNEAALDQYTFSVAGAVGLLLSDLWAWYDGTQTNRTHAIGFGRGLQAVNIIRNHSEDLRRNVDFYPQGWRGEDMRQYARRNLKLADYYTKALPPGPALNFCKIPLALAYATLEVLALGKEKLTRSDVMALVQQISS
jgi:farnesyl-diphosphate farnesyltransferase